MRQEKKHKNITYAQGRKKKKKQSIEIASVPEVQFSKDFKAAITKIFKSRALVAHTCNPSYRRQRSGGS
jgi:hypothetical protein